MEKEHGFIQPAIMPEGTLTVAQDQEVKGRISC
jgi:hypothetical protein